MNVYIDKEELGSIAIARTMKAIKTHAPGGVHFVDSAKSSNLIILNVVGRLKHLGIKIRDFNKPYIIIQYAQKSTLNPNPNDWLHVWKDARLVWSYYDLGKFGRFNFYRSPLGVDSAFKRHQTAKEYVIATSGVGYLQESVRECIHAARKVNRRVFHVGPIFKELPEIDFSNGMGDADLAKKYSACEFVSGLRRYEGFEFPVIEGFVCGARPICFDAPHYRQWFNDFAIFIPKVSRDEIVNHLIEIFKSHQKPVTDKEILEVRRRFDWKKIVDGFWKHI